MSSLVRSDSIIRGWMRGEPEWKEKISQGLIKNDQGLLVSGAMERNGQRRTIIWKGNWHLLKISEHCYIIVVLPFSSWFLREFLRYYIIIGISLWFLMKRKTFTAVSMSELGPYYSFGFHIFLSSSHAFFGSWCIQVSSSIIHTPQLLLCPLHRLFSRGLSACSLHFSTCDLFFNKLCLKSVLIFPPKSPVSYRDDFTCLSREAVS